MSNDHKSETELIDTNTVHSVLEALDDRVDSLNGETLSRLNQMRQQAIVNTPQPWWQRQGLAWSGVLTCMLAVVLWIGQPTTPTEPVAVLADTEIELLQENLDMLDELEMLFWLAEMQADDELV